MAQAKREGGKDDGVGEFTVFIWAGAKELVAAEDFQRSVKKMNSQKSSWWSGAAVTGLVLLALVTSSGCVAVVAGAGVGAAVAVAYVRGDLDATLNASLDRSLQAAKKAVTQLQFAKVSENKDALQAIVVSRNAADKRIDIRLEKVTDAATKLKIRVGTFGDEALSLAILEKIKANL